MSIAKHNTDWLALLDISGPFLSLPVLLKTFPQGLEGITDSTLPGRLRAAYQEWGDNQQGLQPNPAIHTAWLEYIFTQALEWDNRALVSGPNIPAGLQTTLPERHDTIRPNYALLNPTTGRPSLLIQTYPADQELDQRLKQQGLTDSPATRMMELLHATELPLGLITNGEQWMLVHAPRHETTSTITWYANLWFEERITLQAFITLLNTTRFFWCTRRPDPARPPARKCQQPTRSH